MTGNAVVSDSRVFIVPRMTLTDSGGWGTDMQLVGLSPSKMKQWMGDATASAEEHEATAEADAFLTKAEAQEASAQVESRIVRTQPSLFSYCPSQFESQTDDV